MGARSPIRGPVRLAEALSMTQPQKLARREFPETA